MASSSISVVIPAYNAMSCIRTAIDSVLHQTVPPDEVIVVDDGSRDATVDVVSSYSARVRLLTQANSGPGAARNKGVRAARAEWIAFLDADDSWLTTKIEKQLPYTRDGRVGIVHCRDASHWSLQQNRRIDFDTLWKKNAIVLSTALVRRRAFDDVGGFSERRQLDGVEDYNLWLRIVAAGWHVATCPEALYRYTPAPGNLTSQTTRFATAELENVRELGERLHLDTDTLERKRLALLDEYGRELVYYRQLRSARPMLAAAFRARPTCRRAAWWLSTLLPPMVLDWRRSVHADTFSAS
jgi:glycosyltransferase involved in cell wall biosynthesis